MRQDVGCVDILNDSGFNILSTMPRASPNTLLYISLRKLKCHQCFVNLHAKPGRKLLQIYLFLVKFCSRFLIVKKGGG